MTLAGGRPGQRAVEGDVPPTLVSCAPLTLDRRIRRRAAGQEQEHGVDAEEEVDADDPPPPTNWLRTYGALDVVDDGVVYSAAACSPFWRNAVSSLSPFHPFTLSPWSWLGVGSGMHLVKARCFPRSGARA